MKLKFLHYGWVVAGVGACILVMNALVVFSSGVFLTLLTSEFGWKGGVLVGGSLPSVTGSFNSHLLTGSRYTGLAS